MKAGTFRAGQAKAAAECQQVADHSGLTGYTSGEIGPQTVGIAELVTTHTEHYINGYDLGQQPDGREWRHATRTPFASSASVRIIETPLAKYGDKVAEIPNGDWLYQERSSELIPDYRTLLFSVYARKTSVTNGTLALDWCVDAETLTVTDATVDTITDSSKSWGVNAYQDMYILVRDGDGRYQHRLIASNTATVLTLDTDLGTILEVGDAVDIIDWASPTMRRIDEATGAVVSSATVRAYADWERFYVVFRPTSTFNRLYVRIRSASGTLWADGAKLEKATKLESGISTAATATTLTDTNRGWVDDVHLNRQVIIVDGDDAGDCQTITDNDQTSITAAFALTPSAASTYIIIPADANLRPSPYLDLGQISASFYEASMYDLYTGTLLVGGGLSDAPRIIVEDGDGNVILKMGDYGDFKGIKFVNGACASFEGGSIIMRADQGHEDADERIKMSYRGIEGWINNDVRKWALLTEGAGFEFLIGTSPLQARIVINDSDGIAAYDDEGRKWWGVQPAEHYFWLGLDGEENTLEFGLTNGLEIHGSAVVDGTLRAAKMVIDDVLIIEDGGEFRFGTGTPDVDFTGLRMYRDGSTYRLEGQNAGTWQARFDSDGKFYASAGDLRIDGDGLTLQAPTVWGLRTSVKWESTLASGVYPLELYCYGPFGSTRVSVLRANSINETYEPELQLSARASASTSASAYLAAFSDAEQDWALLRVESVHGGAQRAVLDTASVTDSVFVFSCGNVKKFGIGVDYSDSFKFKINSGDSLADVSDFELDTSGNAEFAGGLTINEGSQDADTRIEGATEDHLFTVDAGTDTVRLGDWDTNYTQFAKDGELTQVGTARVTVDMYVTASGVKAPGLKPATFALHGLAGAWSFANATAGNEQSISGTLKLPSQMDKTVAPVFKVGWSATGVSPGDCEWQLEYRYMAPNDNTTAGAQQTLAATGTASGTTDGLIITSFAALQLPGATDQAMFFEITRLSADPSDTLAIASQLHGMLFTHTRDKLGTAT